MSQTADLFEKLAPIFLYNFHRKQKSLKLKIKKVIAENQYENIKHRVSTSIVVMVVLIAPDQQVCTLQLHPTSSQDGNVFQHLDRTEACCPDPISTRLLKEGCHIIAHPYSIIFYHSLEQGYSPPSWKDANVTSIYKKEDISLPSNYRPIPLPSIVGKTMERCVHKHNYMVTNQFLTPLQSRFKEGNSNDNHLLHTYHTICEAVHKGKEIRAVFAILVRPSTESGTKDYFTSCVAWGAKIVLSIGL